MFEKKVEYHVSNTYDAYKLFTYTNLTYASAGLTINNSTAPQSNSISAIENTSSYNHFFLRHNFYSIYNNSSFYAFKSKYAKQNNYVLQENSKLISIPIKSFGKKIFPGSFVLQDDVGTFVDDGYGNILDTSLTSSNYVSSDTLKFWFSFDDGYVYKQFPYKKQLVLKDNSQFLNTLTAVNPTFTQGVSGSGYKLDFNGYNSYAYIDNNDFTDFSNTDFVLSFWAVVPPSQHVTSSATNAIVSKKTSSTTTFPFHISVYNQSSANNGKLLVSRRGHKDNNKLMELSFTSSVSINDSEFHHIILSRESSSICLYIDGTLDSSIADYNGYYSTNNASKIFIGGYSSGEHTAVSDSLFSGSIDELRLYSSVVSSGSLYNYPFNTNIVGSIFYEKGIVVFNNLSGSYSSILNNTFSMTYRSISEITEHEICVKKEPSEFNMTMNPSLRENGGHILKSNLTSSFQNDFTPYITGIGLYNDQNQLLAVAKIRQPIKSMKDIGLYFKIRFDM